MKFLLFTVFCVFFVNFTSSKRHYSNRKLRRCVDAFCPSGRVCDSSGSKCICGPGDFCSDRLSPVCGSDGRSYLSHCELHRQACVLGKHIRPAAKGPCPLITTESSLAKTTDVDVEPTSSTIIEHGDFKTQSSIKKCTNADRVKLRSLVIGYQCYQLGRELCENDKLKGYRVLRNLIFTFLDHDADSYITENDLQQVELIYNITPDGSSCSLSNLFPTLKFSDERVDKTYFARLFGLGTLSGSLGRISSWKSIRVKVGKSVTLECDIGQVDLVDRFVWFRNEIQLDNVRHDYSSIGRAETITMHDVTVADAGMYSCHSEHDVTQRQNISLSVIAEPIVHVFPNMIVREEGSQITFFCYSPTADQYNSTYEWLFDSEPIFNKLEYFALSANGTVLSLKSSQHQNTGIYSCRVRNFAGQAVAAGSLYVRKVTESDYDSYPITSDHLNSGILFFHGSGYSLYDVDDCGPKTRVSVDDDNRLCEDLMSCKWDVIQQAGSLLYVSQPPLGRVVVIERRHLTNYHFISVNCPVTHMTYDHNRDRLWLACSSNQRIFTVDSAGQLTGLAQRTARPWMRDVFDRVLALPESESDWTVVAQDVHTTDTKRHQLIFTLDFLGHKDAAFKIASNVIIDKATYIPQGGLLLLYSSSANASSIFVYDVKAKHQRTDLFTQPGRLFVSPARNLLLYLVGNNVIVYKVTADGQLQIVLKDAAGVSLRDVVFTRVADKEQDKILAITDRASSVLSINLVEKSLELIFDDRLANMTSISAPEFGDSGVMYSNIFSVVINSNHVHLAACSDFYQLEIQRVHWLST